MATEANIKAAKELVKLYNSMTIEKIDDCGIGFDEYRKKKEILTGFGTLKTCTLCISVDSNCDQCIYQDECGCSMGPYRKSYEAILQAKDSESLLKAYKERAKVINKLLKSISK